MNPATILALAPNGAYKQKSDHPEVPINIEEIVQTAVDAQRAGATLLHLHIRDKEGLHSLNPDTYLHTIDVIKARIGKTMIIQITSESAGRYLPDQQSAIIQAVNPECVSIALREFIPDTSQFLNAQALFHWCAEKQCRIQFILYSEADLLCYLKYRGQDTIPSAPHSVLFVLGRYTLNQASSEADLAPFLAHYISPDTPWMVCAFGASEQRCLLDAAKKGGHMRIGFENNILNADGLVAKDNIEQLRDISNKAVEAGITIATIQQARQMMKIRQT